MEISAFTREELDWAAKTAAQLKLIQGDFADAEATERKSYLEEEIRRSLRNIVAEKRPVHLQALSMCFPVGETWNVLDGTQAPSAAAESSPEELVGRLIAMAPALSRGTLMQLGAQLQKAGFMEAAQAGPASAEPPDEFVQKMGLEPNGAVDLQRLYKFTQTLSEFVVNMDKVAWNIWRAIAPKSKVRKDTTANGDFRKLAARYVGGDSEVSLAQISQLVDKLRQLLAGILTGIGPGGRSFAKQHLAQFSPEAIKGLANLESGMFVGVEQKSWRKYVELSAELSEDAVEAKFHEAVARYAEDLIRGTARTPDA